MSQYFGTLPSGVHSFNLKSGDVINASLNWVGGSNLDLYLDAKSSEFPGSNVQAGNGWSKP